MEDRKGLGKRYLEVSTRDFPLFDTWFSSRKEVEAAASIGVDFIRIVKMNTKVYCKATIEGLTKDYPGVFHIVLRSKHIVPGERPLLAIGYKYNLRNVLSFFDTAGTGSTTLCIPYLSKYP